MLRSQHNNQQERMMSIIECQYVWIAKAKANKAAERLGTYFHHSFEDRFNEMLACSQKYTATVREQQQK
jgi:hypothetical protein